MKTNHHRPTCASHKGDACNCIYGSKIRKLFGAKKTATELRDEGIDLVEEHTPDDWRERCDAEIERQAGLGWTFTAEDIREFVGSPKNHPNAMGARFRRAAQKKIIVVVGFSLGTRRESHARLLRKYKGSGL